MEPKVADSITSEAYSDVKLSQCSCVASLLKTIDALNEEVKKSVDVIDDEALQALSSRLDLVQEVLHNESELRQRIPGETVDRLKQNQLPARVKLNVGGKMFATSLTALTSIKGTFFESMFGGRWPLTPERDGTFSIGRDPTGFSLVLQFLRGDKIDTKTISDGEMAAFIADVDYYGLPIEVVEKWVGMMLRPIAGEQFSSEDHSDSIVLSEKNTSIHSRSYQRWVLGANRYGGQDHVVVTMRINQMIGWAMVGVVGQRPVSQPSHDPTCHGWDVSGGRWCAGNYEGICALGVSTGDLIQVEIDCKQSKLTVRNPTNDVSDTLMLPAGKQWRLFVDLLGVTSSVSIVESKSL